MFVIYFGHGQFCWARLFRNNWQVILNTIAKMKLAQEKYLMFCPWRQIGKRFLSRSMAVVMMLLSHCLWLLLLSVRVLFLFAPLFCYTVLSAISIIAVRLLRESESVFFF